MRKLLFCILFLSTYAQSEEFYPENLILLDDYFTHHIVIAEKSTHRLFLYENQGGFPKLIQTYSMATGKKAGDKQNQGDHRTPEGVYEFTEFLPHKALIDRHGEAGRIYGVGAFVMDYPNPMDRREHKSGGGIWLHSTNDETRIEKGLDSRGCVVTRNKDLIDIAKYLELSKSHIVVVDSLKHLSDVSHKKTKDKVMAFLANWTDAWSNENVATYLSHYHPSKFQTPSGKKFGEFANYKERVFSYPGKPEVKLGNVSILQTNQYVKVTFTQHYKSNTINDTGKKTLFLVRDQYYSYKIVEERWQKIPAPEKQEGSAITSFEPSMRFFDSYTIDESIFKKSNN